MQLHLSEGNPDPDTACLSSLLLFLPFRSKRPLKSVPGGGAGRVTSHVIVVCCVAERDSLAGHTPQHSLHLSTLLASAFMPFLSAIFARIMKCI